MYYFTELVVQIMAGIIVKIVCDWPLQRQKIIIPPAHRALKKIPGKTRLFLFFIHFLPLLLPLRFYTVLIPFLTYWAQIHPIRATFYN